MAFLTGVWNLRALNSGRPGSPRSAMRHKVRRIRSPPKCAAETPPAEAETKNNTSEPATGTQKPESPRRPKKTANGFSIHAAPPPSRRQARAAACAEAPQALAEGACAHEPLRQSSCRYHAERRVPAAYRRGCSGCPGCEHDADWSRRPAGLGVDSPEVRPPAHCDRSRVRSLSRLSSLQTSTDIDAAPYIRRGFGGTAVGTATEASRVQWPPYAACCRLWHGSGLCGDGSKEGAGVVDLFRRACFCRSEYASFGFRVASTQRWAFLARDLSP